VDNLAAPGERQLWQAGRDINPRARHGAHVATQLARDNPTYFQPTSYPRLKTDKNSDKYFCRLVLRRLFRSYPHFAQHHLYY
jgi:hypothetical protein